MFLLRNGKNKLWFILVTPSHLELLILSLGCDSQKGFLKHARYSKSSDKPAHIHSVLEEICFL